MSILRSLRAYIGLGPDEDYEDSYLYDLDLRSDDVDDSENGQKEQDALSERVIHLDGGSGRNSASSDSAEGMDVPEDDLDTDGSERATVGSVTRGAVSTRTRRKAESSSQSRRSGRAESRRTKDKGNPKANGDHINPFEEPSADSGRGSDESPALDLRSDQDRLDPESGDEITDGVVRSLAKHRSRPRTISPRTFADSKVLADEFIRGVPIVLDLRGEGRELSRRLIDFASGVCYSLDGQMEKVSPQVFLLIPAEARVTEEDRALIEDGGYIR